MENNQLPVRTDETRTLNKTRIALAGIFTAAALVGGYNAYYLNDYVWSVPGKGGIRQFRDGEISEYVLAVERERNLFSRTDYIHSLSVYFNRDSAHPRQVCIDSAFEQGGIFYINPDHPFALKWSKENPQFKDNIRDFVQEEGSSLHLNTYFSTSTFTDCSDSVAETYKDQLAEVIALRSKQLSWFSWP